MIGTFGVASEVGALHRVLLHRPSLELQRLTPSNAHSLLFDDVLWVKRARQEHDVFADTLREEGVEVYYLAELLAGPRGGGAPGRGAGAAGGWSCGRGPGGTRPPRRDRHR